MSVFEPLKDLLRSNGFDPTGIDTALEDFQPSSDVAVEHAFQFIVENQRGMKFFGIPCFNRKLLIPGLDPPQYTRIDGSKVKLSDDRIGHYPLPDLGWKWAWDLWYVLMLNDVDEQGWKYLGLVFRKRLHWHGKYYLGNFVRRRLWVRLRVREVQSDSELLEGEKEASHTATPVISPLLDQEELSPVQSLVHFQTPDIEHQAELTPGSPHRKKKPLHLVTTWA